MEAFDVVQEEVMLLLAQYLSGSLPRLWCYVKFSPCWGLFYICKSRGWLKWWIVRSLLCHTTLLWSRFLLFLCWWDFFHHDCLFCGLEISHISLSVDDKLLPRPDFAPKLIKSFIASDYASWKMSKSYLKNIFQLNVHVEESRVHLHVFGAVWDQL